MRIARRDVLMLGAMAALAPCGAGAALPAPPRLLAFGDSLTAGYGLAPDEGLVPVLSGWLAARGHPVRLLNAGLSGDSTYGGRVRIGWSLLRRPDAAIVALGGNDMLMGLAPEQAEANLDAILARATAGGRPVLLVGVRAPDPARQPGWAAIWPRLAERHGTLLWPDLFAPLAALAPDRLAQALQPDGVHPTASGVRIIVEGLGPLVLRLLDRLDRDQDTGGAG
ncbi:arylesterase [Paracoccus spongiarum]|uniref:Arylesterase n=1 Tax=Paracoccus spongiarum TaxID=3064387 RepID=A0ABT9JCF2_9RHOB|nr:arylesterase [Paracoccus sp. 2205BS29-5]MDP5307493.1 arylesterase [Paracoccus sp. 2205BS29-5]